ncbi:hypothetical protein F5877DRAFT_86690 [Lentinula edodes]|nr:hypothetical protein F5877DRAFT_86690 [Lentinula edodes]
MSFLPSKAPSHAGLSRSLLPCSSSREEVATSLDSNGEVEQDQLAFTIESPSTPQLQLFKNIFNMGKSLASYCHDDPLWPTQAAVAISCSNCTQHPETCKVPLGVPFALRVLWTIPEDTWRRYDEQLHSSMLATKVLVELNMLNEQDSQDVNHQDLEQFQQAQAQEAELATCQRNTRSSPPPKVPSKRKCSTKKHPLSSKPSEEVPPLVRLVFPPSQPAPSSIVPLTSPFGSSVTMSASPALVRDGGRTGLPQGSPSLVQLAEVMDRQTNLRPGGSDCPLASLPPAINNVPSKLSSSNMPSIACPPLVPRVLSQHPYHLENEHLATCVRQLEPQLEASRQENSTLASALTHLNFG